MSRWLWQWLQLPGWPTIPRRLWLTLGGFLLCVSNLLLKEELWPHTPAAPLCFRAGAWLLLVLVLPQLVWIGWCWLQAWQGPILLRCLATVVFLAGATLGGIMWLFLLIGGLYNLLNGRMPQ